MMLGKYTAEQIKNFFAFLREGKTTDAKEFRQSRVVFVKQEGKIFGGLKEAAFIEHILQLRSQIYFERPFRIHIISAKSSVGLREVSSKDALEFSFMTYKGFALPYELEGEKIALVEGLLKKQRLPADLWEKPGFQLFRWETQVFDVSATGEVEEVV